MAQVIVVGGGLSGLSSAHTALERGCRVVLLDKNAFCGGNSTKATSGINGAPTHTQAVKKIQDSAEIFLQDTVKGGSGGNPNVKPWPLAKVLTYGSGPAVDWLTDKFKLDLSLVSRLGGHSQPRTHRGKERFPGMTITYGLMEKYEEICKNEPHRARLINEADVKKLLTDSTGAVTGVQYIKGGKTYTEEGAVIIATGGYAADFSSNDSLLKKHRPDLMHLPTTNGEHCTGDGIKMALEIGADTVDLDFVQVHPTGLVHPDEPNAKVKFLAAEALRGVGGLLIDNEGNRFCNELGTRDYVTGCMWKHNKGPYRLLINSPGAKEIQWHITHYCGRGLMKEFKGGDALAKEMKIDGSVLKQTFGEYNAAAKKGEDKYGKKFFQYPFDYNDNLFVAWVTPVLHYCMGGLKIDTDSQVIGTNGKPVPGLFGAGEVVGGIHGKNRLGGSSLLDCVVFGRVSGDSAARYLLDRLTQGKIATAASGVSASGFSATVEMDPASKKVTLNLSWDKSGAVASAAPAAAAAAPAAAAPAEEKKAPAQREYTMEEVAKHNTEKDCWVVVNGQVLDATSFLSKHPGGKQAILLFAGKDASTEFNLLHKPDVVTKYAPEIVIGTLKGAQVGVVSVKSSVSATTSSKPIRANL